MVTYLFPAVACGRNPYEARDDNESGHCPECPACSGECVRKQVRGEGCEPIDHDETGSDQ